MTMRRTDERCAESAPRRRFDCRPASLKKSALFRATVCLRQLLAIVKQWSHFLRCCTSASHRFVMTRVAPGWPFIAWLRRRRRRRRRRVPARFVKNANEPRVVALTVPYSWPAPG